MKDETSISCKNSEVPDFRHDLVRLFNNAGLKLIKTDFK